MTDMTPQRQRWTVVTNLRWAVVGLGVCWIMIGILVACGSYAVALQAATESLKPFLGILNSLGMQIFIYGLPDEELVLVGSPTIGLFIQIDLWPIGNLMVASGFVIVVIASTLIVHAKRSCRAD